MTQKYPAKFSTKRAELAMIHMAATRLGMDTSDKNPDSEYRSMLWSVARVRSSASLDFAGRKKVIDHLNALLDSHGLEKVGGKKPTRQLADDPQSKMIRGLWLEMHRLGIVKNPAESALCAFVKRETGIEALQWLTPIQASQVIERLKQWKQRGEKAHVAQ